MARWPQSSGACSPYLCAHLGHGWRRTRPSHATEAATQAAHGRGDDGADKGREEEPEEGAGGLQLAAAFVGAVPPARDGVGVGVGLVVSAVRSMDTVWETGDGGRLTVLLQLCAPSSFAASTTPATKVKIVQRVSRMIRSKGIAMDSMKTAAMP